MCNFLLSIAPPTGDIEEEGEKEENEGGGDEEGHMEEVAEIEEGEGGAGLVVGGEREVRGETGVEEVEGSDDELEDDDL